MVCFWELKGQCPDASKFETFIPLVRLVFELELFKATINISVFDSETRITQPIASKICTKKDSYVSHLSSKFQVSNFSRFKVIAFSNFVYEFVIFQGKNIRDFRRKVSRKSQLRKKSVGIIISYFWELKGSAQMLLNLKVFILHVQLSFEPELFNPICARWGQICPSF